MTELDLTTHSPEQTQALGEAIGGLALPGDVFLLVGELGAGKTCLTQGIAWGLGIDEYASSPTFVIMREHHGRLSLYHVDLYRLGDLAEIDDLGLDDYVYGGGVCVVEWAEKGLGVLPEEHLLVEVARLGDTDRRFKLRPSGERYREMIARLKQSMPFRERG
jgi:tRNA threonylcarbamoyladenosine biosynthesis protein TsaE